METHHQQHPLDRLLPFIIVGLATAFYVYQYFLRVMPSAMPEQLMRHFDISARGLGILASMFFFGMTPMQIPAGLLYDRFGARRLLTITITICAAGTFIFGYTDIPSVASAARFFIGVAAAFSFIGSLVLASRWFPPRYFAMITGLVQLLGCFGAIAGEEPVAIIVNHIGSRATFFWAAGFGAALAVLCWFFVKDRAPGQKATQIHKPQMSELQRLTKVCRKPQTWWVGLYAFCTWAPVTVFAALWGVPFLMTLYHQGSETAAIGVSLVWVGIGLSSPLIGWWSNRIANRRTPMIIAMILGLVASTVVLFVPHPSWPLMFLALLVFGFGPAGQVISFGVVQDIHPPEVAGTAVGFNNMAVVAGGVLLQPLVGILLKANWGGEMLHHVPVYSISDYRVALSILPVCFAVGLITCFFIKETHCQAQY